MNLAFPDTDLLSCSAAFVPWVGGLAAKATVLLAAILVVGALMARRHAPVRHLTATLGLLGLLLLPLLSLSLTWENQPAPAFSAQRAMPMAGVSGELPTVLLAAWGAVASLLLAWLALDLGLLWWHIRRSTVPLEQQRELATGISAVCSDTQLAELDCIRGHDSFLVEMDAFRPVICKFFESCK